MRYTYDLVTPEIVERSSALDTDDIGKYSITCPVTAVVYIRTTEEAARELCNALNNPPK